MPTSSSSPTTPLSTTGTTSRFRRRQKKVKRRTKAGATYSVLKNNMLLLPLLLLLLAAALMMPVAMTAVASSSSSSLLRRPQRQRQRQRGGDSFDIRSSTPGAGTNGTRRTQQQAQFFTNNNRPRIRREWRTLSSEDRQRVADAMWEMKTLTTTEGRDLYGPRFANADDMTVQHACATATSECDQGHYGPHFANFHRAYLLKFENSLLAVDPRIEALPYWDMSRDSVDGGDCYEDEDCSIWTDDFFGDIRGDASQNYAVTNGLFAWWPVTEYSSSRFGSNADDSPFAQYRCLSEDWLRDDDLPQLDRCGVDWLRGPGGGPLEQDCGTPYVARNPDEVPRLGGTRDIQYTQEDFDACTSAVNIRSYADWENCVQMEQLACAFELMGGDEDCEDRVESLRRELPDEAPYDLDPDEICRDECTLTGFYFDSSGEKRRANSLHIQPHIRLGREMFDGSTSSNDVSVFTAHHANVDRSHMTWMANTWSELGGDAFWNYPRSQSEYELVNEDHMNGPFALADVLQSCSTGGDGADPWKEGTLLDDVVNPGFPFDDLWDEPPENGVGYTHAEGTKTTKTTFCNDEFLLLVLDFLAGFGCGGIIVFSFTSYIPCFLSLPLPLQSSITRTRVEPFTRTIRSRTCTITRITTLLIPKTRASLKGQIDWTIQTV